MLEYLEASQSHGLVTVDEAGRVRMANKAALKLFGWQKGHVLGRKLHEVLAWPEMEEARKSGRGAYGIRTCLGRHTIISDYLPWPDGEGGRGAAAFFHDISLQEAESQERDYFKELYRELQTVIDSSYDGFLITDGKGKILQVNKAYERIRGLSADQVVGKSFSQLIDEGLYSYSLVDEVLKEKGTVSVMLSPRNAHLLFTANPIFDNQGNVSRIVFNLRDMSELTQLRFQLDSMREQSQRYASELNELRAQSMRTNGVIVQSRGMRQVLDLALRVSQVSSTVIITGESGVGKEIVAKVIHNHSPRRGEPFIKVNCGAIPDNLLESELFGYEPGAFTGAAKTGKPGLFELADKGTLFLDEVGDLAFPLQAKLLRALQEKEIVRVGGVKPRRVDARIIAATNHVLEDMVKEGRFREDLFFRLNVVPIHLPSLRDRPEDILPLAYHFRDMVNQRYHMKKDFSPEVLEDFLNYPWPGNVRELENIVERVMVTALENLIREENLPNIFSKTGEEKGPSVQVRGILPLRQALAEAERQLLMEALSRYRSPDKVAEVLGVNRATIFRKLKALRDAP